MFHRATGTSVGGKAQQEKTVVGWCKVSMVFHKVKQATQRKRVSNTENSTAVTEAHWDSHTFDSQP